MLGSKEIGMEICYFLKFNLSVHLPFIILGEHNIISYDHVLIVCHHLVYGLTKLYFAKKINHVPFKKMN